MKQSGMTIVFVIVCIGVLVAAYGVGVCFREIRFHRARIGSEVAVKTDKPGTGSQPEKVAQKPTPAPAKPDPNRPALAQDQEDRPFRPRMGEFGRMPGMPTREELENMSEEERRAAIDKMRERMGGFGGRQREGGPQLSEEDRAKMREEFEKLRENWDQMSEEEKQKVEAQFREKYGYFRSPDARGGRGFGGGRRRTRPDEGQ
jgi:hypothetical protein